jgi:hypothetical protein
MQRIRLITGSETFEKSGPEVAFQIHHITGCQLTLTAIAQAVTYIDVVVPAQFLGSVCIFLLLFIRIHSLIFTPAQI